MSCNVGIHNWVYAGEYSATMNIERCSICGETRLVAK